MAWNQQGGPWGGGGNNGGGPWGGRGPGGGNGGGGGGGGGGQQPPDLEELLRKSQERLRKWVPGGGRGGSGGGAGIGARTVVLIAAGVLIAWGLTGFYRVQPDEQGVELLFGKYVKTTGPGLNYWFPGPIGDVQTPKVTLTNQLTIGFRGGADPRNGGARDVPQESMMLTGDQNIIDTDFIVQWRISDAGNYLFNIRDPETTVKAASESAMREVIGQTPLETAMTEGRAEVQARAATLLQQILDGYNAGITILDVKLLKADPPAEVIDAFNDVQRARQDKERLQNEAQAYRNDIVPRAKGEAERMIQEAQAYKQSVIAAAQGEADRFGSVLESYRTAQDVTTQRLYLETMQDVLSRSDKVLVDSQNGGAGANGVVPYQPLPELQRRAHHAPTAPAAGTTATTNTFSQPSSPAPTLSSAPQEAAR